VTAHALWRARLVDPGSRRTRLHGRGRAGRLGRRRRRLSAAALARRKAFRGAGSCGSPALVRRGFRPAQRVRAARRAPAARPPARQPRDRPASDPRGRRFRAPRPGTNGRARRRVPPHRGVVPGAAGRRGRRDGSPSVVPRPATTNARTLRARARAQQGGRRRQAGSEPASHRSRAAGAPHDQFVTLGTARSCPYDALEWATRG
jgi:hypothetical protein